MREELEERHDQLDHDFIAFVAEYEQAQAEGRPLPEPIEALKPRWQRVSGLFPLFDRARLSPMSGAISGVGSWPSSWGNVLSGRRIAHYRLERVLGRGGMGVVYLARDLTLDRTVALKVLHPAAAERPGRRARFEVEGRLLARLRHANLVQVHESGEQDDVAYLAMEFVNGPTLHETLKTQRPEPRAAAVLVEQLARAVAHAHAAGVIHRDLKAANVLMTEDGTPKISDFGLGTVLGSGPGLTVTGEVIGTPNYLAPEMVVPSGIPTGPAVDVYGLGTILYEALTGRPPFLGDSIAFVLVQVQFAGPVAPRTLRPEVPRDLETICLKCLEKVPEHRYPSATALAEELRRFLDGKPIEARPVAPAEQFWRWARRKPMIAGLLASVLALLVVGTAVSTWFGLDARRQALEARRHEALANTASVMASAAQAQAVAEKRTADLRSAEMTFQIALQLAESGAVDRGLFQMLRAWRQAPRDATAFRTAIRANLAGWSRQFPRLRQAVQVHDSWAGWRFIAGGDPEGRTFLTGFDGPGSDQVFDSATGRASPLPPSLKGMYVYNVSPDGRWLCLDRNPKFAVFDQHSGIEPPGIADFVKRYGRPYVDGAPDLVYGHDKNGARVYWDLLMGRELPARLRLASTDRLRLTRTGTGRIVALVFRGNPADPTSSRPVHLETVDLETGKPLDSGLSLAGGTDPAVSYDGREVVSESPGEWRWMDPRNGLPLDKTWRPRHWAAQQRLGCDGMDVLHGTVDYYLRVFDLATGYQRGGDLLREPQTKSLGTGGSIWDYSEHQDMIFGDSATISPDGRLVFTFSREKIARVWDTSLCRYQATASVMPRHAPAGRPPGAPEVEHAIYSPVGRRVLLTRRLQNLALLLDARTGSLLGPPIQQELVEHAAFSPDGRYLATAPWRGVNSDAQVTTPLVVLRDGATGRPIGRPWEAPKLIQTLAFSPDGKLLAAGGVAGTFILDVPTNTLRHHLREATCVRGLKWNADSRRLIVTARPGWSGVGDGLRVWNAQSGEPLGPFRSAGLGHYGPVATWLVGPAGEGADDTLVSCESTLPGLIRLSPDGKDVQGTSEPLGPMRLVCFSDDGQRMSASTSPSDVHQWDARTGKPIGPVMRHSEPTQMIRYSPDGKLMAVSCVDHSIRLWDGATGWPLGPPLLHLSMPVAFAFADANKTLLSITESGIARTWPIPQPIDDNPDRFETWVQARCGLRLDGEEPVQVTVPEWHSARKTLENRWPQADPALDEMPDDLVSWHRQRALDAKEVGNQRGELYHLKQLAALRPSERAIHMRIAAIHIRVAVGLPRGPLRDCEGRLALAAAKRWLAVTGVDPTVVSWRAISLSEVPGTSAMPHVAKGVTSATRTSFSVLQGFSASRKSVAKAPTCATCFATSESRFKLAKALSLPSNSRDVFPNGPWSHDCWVYP